MECLTKADLQRYVSNLPDDAVLCPTCCSRMRIYDSEQGDVYGCPNMGCHNEEQIPVDQQLPEKPCLDGSIAVQS